MVQFSVENEEKYKHWKFSCLARNEIIPAPEDAWFCRACLLSLLYLVSAKELVQCPNTFKAMQSHYTKHWISSPVAVL